MASAWITYCGATSTLTVAGVSTGFYSPSVTGSFLAATVSAFSAKSFSLIYFTFAASNSFFNYSAFSRALSAFCLFLVAVSMASSASYFFLSASALAASSFSFLAAATSAVASINFLADSSFAFSAALP